MGLSVDNAALLELVKPILIRRILKNPSLLDMERGMDFGLVPLHELVCP